MLEKWLKSWLAEGTDEKGCEVCVVCLGVLQAKYCNKSFLDEVGAFISLVRNLARKFSSATCVSCDLTSK